VLFLSELVALVEDGLGTAGEFVERRAGEGDIVSGLGKCVSR